MTTPTILPTNRDGTYKDYLKCKVDRSGAVREQYATVSVPSGTTVATVVGLVPFNKGFRLDYGATQLAVGALGTSVTVDIGYVYKTGSTATDDVDAFATLLTAATAGGLLVLDEPIGLSWVAEDDGWIAVTIRGATTGTTGSIFGQVNGAYDGINVSN